jgi:hypothetical protein
MIVAILLAAFAMSCDKPAPTEEPASEPAKTEEAEKPAEESKEAAPAEAPESAAHDHEHGDKKAEMPADMKAGEQGFYGEKFTIIEPPFTLASAIEKGAGKVKIEATVAAVCK